MAGSRKGEKRGAAKGAEAGARKTPQLPTKPEKPTLKPRGRGESRATEEYWRTVHRMVTGETGRNREPREVMLNCMSYFHAQFDEYWAHERNLAAQLDAAIQSKAPADQVATLWKELMAAKTSARDMAQLASDIGMKVGPYVNARMSAIAVHDSRAAPLEAIGMLLRDISTKNRAEPSWKPRLIEHDKDEKVA